MAESHLDNDRLGVVGVVHGPHALRAVLVEVDGRHGLEVRGGEGGVGRATAPNDAAGSRRGGGGGEVHGGGAVGPGGDGAAGTGIEAGHGGVGPCARVVRLAKGLAEHQAAAARAASLHGGPAARQVEPEEEVDHGRHDPREPLSHEGAFVLIVRTVGESPPHRYLRVWNGNPSTNSHNPCVTMHHTDPSAGMGQRRGQETRRGSEASIGCCCREMMW